MRRRWPVNVVCGDGDCSLALGADSPQTDILTRLTRVLGLAEATSSIRDRES